MTKFLVLYDRDGILLGVYTRRYVGFELIESKDFFSAYEDILTKLILFSGIYKGIHLRRLRIRSIEQVSDDFRPSDVHIESLAQIEERHRHEEAMAKGKVVI